VKQRKTWYELLKAGMEWKEEAVGSFWGLTVVAAWARVVYDSENPYRWTVLLEGPSHPIDSVASSRVFTGWWGRARTEEEAQGWALRKATELLEALPGDWTYIYAEEDLPF